MALEQIDCEHHAHLLDLRIEYDRAMALLFIMAGFAGGAHAGLPEKPKALLEPIFADARTMLDEYYNEQHND